MESVQHSENDNEGKEAAALIHAEDEARAATYAILAALLSDVPSADLLDYLCHIDNPDGSDSPGDVGEAWLELRTAAKAVDAEKLDDEFHALFIGLGRGEIVPYGSWHLTGFLMEKPLSELRDDLRSLGFESDPEHKEPEDHIAAICETLSILIQSPDVEGFQQRRFFLSHLLPWGEKFFRELKSAKNADFYRAVGLLGERFMQLEGQYLNVQQH